MLIKQFLKAVATLGLASACALAASQTRTTRILVAFPPGGPVDFTARTLSEQLGKELNQTVIIENKAGANGAIAAETLLKSPADGSTLWLTSVGAVAINPALYPNLPYNPVNDLAPVSLVVNNVELLVVHPGSAANNPQQFIDLAKQRRTTMASSGTGSVPHLAMELLAGVTQANLVHVPYKGAAPAITDVMAGHVDGFFGDIPGLIPHIRSGKLKPVALASTRRHPLFPDIRTFEEIGVKGVDSDNWYALFVHRNTPPTDIDRLNQAVRRTLTADVVRQKLLASGAEPAPTSPSEMAALLKSDMEKWGRVIRENKIKAD